MRTKEKLQSNANILFLCIKYTVQCTLNFCLIIYFFSYPPNFFIQELNFGFFNYAGLDRQVRLYTTPTVYVSDVHIVTDFTENQGIYRY